MAAAALATLTAEARAGFEDVRDSDVLPVIGSR